MQRVSRYQWLLVIMHWLMALLLPVASAGGALVLVKIPNTDPSKIEGLRQHMAGGILLLTLMLIRWVVRVRTAHPARASTGNSVLDSVAWLSHRLIYVLVLGQAFTGATISIRTRLSQLYDHLFSAVGELARTIEVVLLLLAFVLATLQVRSIFHHDTMAVPDSRCTSLAPRRRAFRIVSLKLIVLRDGSRT